MIGRGKYAKGMVVEIPAKFFDSSNQPVDVNDVVVDIQYFDNARKQVIHLLPETPMPPVAKGMYLYRYNIPPQVDNGKYVVTINAKYSGNPITPKSDFFIITDKVEGEKTALTPVDISMDMSSDTPPPASDDRLKDFDIKTFRIDKAREQNQQKRIDIEDMVVDVYNMPVKGVHVNAFEKNGFMPKSPNNVKVGSTMTDQDGVWRMSIPPGEYVFTYKGIALKENREFRKV